MIATRIISLEPEISPIPFITSSMSPYESRISCDLLEQCVHVSYHRIDQFYTIIVGRIVTRGNHDTNRRIAFLRPKASDETNSEHYVREYVTTCVVCQLLIPNDSLVGQRRARQRGWPYAFMRNCDGYMISRGRGMRRAQKAYACGAILVLDASWNGIWLNSFRDSLLQILVRATVGGDC